MATRRSPHYGVKTPLESDPKPSIINHDSGVGADEREALEPTGNRYLSTLTQQRKHVSAQNQTDLQGVILLAEDQEDEVMLLRRAFTKARFLNPLQVVSNGEEAIAYLQGAGKYADRAEYPMPSLLLLDLKMPRKDGFEVLYWIRQHPSLSELRVVVLTASDQIRDVNRAYEMGANSFLIKPVEFGAFVEMTRALKGYWCWISQEPEIPRFSRSPQAIEEKSRPADPPPNGIQPPQKPENCGQGPAPA